MHQQTLIEFKEPTPPTVFRWPVKVNEKFKCSVVPEQRGNNVYWFMRKTYKGKTVNLYVGRHGQLSDELLNNAVNTVKHRLGVQS